MNWEIQESGWWTSEIGGLCSDGGKWFFWPKDDHQNSPAAGPWKTLKEAKYGVEAAYAVALHDGKAKP